MSKKQYEKMELSEYDFEHLEPGDALVKKFYARDPVSHIIQTGQAVSHPLSGHADVVHAAIYLGGGKVLEWQGEGIVENSLQANLRHGYKYIVFRYRGRNRESIIREALDFARTQQERTRPYSLGKAVKSLFRTRKAKASEKVSLLGDPEYYCSEFVAACYNQAGYVTDTRPLPMDVNAADLNPAALIGYLEKSDKWEEIGKLG